MGQSLQTHAVQPDCSNPQNSFKFHWRSKSIQKYQTSPAEFWRKTSRRFPFDGKVQPKKHVGNIILLQSIVGKSWKLIIYTIVYCETVWKKSTLKEHLASWKIQQLKLGVLVGRFCYL